MDEMLPQSTLDVAELLARQLRQRRLELGWSQVEVAAMLGVSGPKLCNWECGRYRPRMVWLVRWAEVLGWGVKFRELTVKEKTAVSAAPARARYRLTPGALVDVGEDEL